MTFLVMYLSPLKPKFYAAKNDFWKSFFKYLSFKIEMSLWGQAGIGSVGNPHDQMTRWK